MITKVFHQKCLINGIEENKTPVIFMRCPGLNHSIVCILRIHKKHLH